MGLFVKSGVEDWISPLGENRIYQDYIDDVIQFRKFGSLKSENEKLHKINFHCQSYPSKIYERP